MWQSHRALARGLGELRVGELRLPAPQLPRLRPTGDGVRFQAAWSAELDAAKGVVRK